MKNAMGEDSMHGIRMEGYMSRDKDRGSRDVSRRRFITAELTDNVTTVISSRNLFASKR